MYVAASEGMFGALRAMLEGGAELCEESAAFLAGSNDADGHAILREQCARHTAALAALRDGSAPIVVAAAGRLKARLCASRRALSEATGLRVNKRRRSLRPRNAAAEAWTNFARAAAAFDAARRAMATVPKRVGAAITHEEGMVRRTTKVTM